MERDDGDIGALDYLISYLVQQYITAKWIIIYTGIWFCAGVIVETYHDLYPEYRARIAQYDAEQLTLNAAKRLGSK